MLLVPDSELDCFEHNAYNNKNQGKIHRYYERIKPWSRPSGFLPCDFAVLMDVFDNQNSDEWVVDLNTTLR